MVPILLGKMAMETKQAVNALKDVDDELDSVRERLVAGSAAAQQFESAISDSAREEVSQIKRFIEIGKLAAKTAVLNATGGMMRMAGMKTEKMLVTQKQLLDAEDEVATALNHQRFSQDEILDLLQKQHALEVLRQNYYSQAATMDRTRVNAAKEMAGELERAEELLHIQMKDEHEIALADREIVSEKLKGRGAVAEMMRSEIEWQHQINQAYREGKMELVKTLQAQRDLDLMQQAAAQKRQTPQERREARTEARRLKSDAEKQRKRDAELDRAILRGARGAEGSKLEERRRQNVARNKMLLNPVGPVAPPELVFLNAIALATATTANNTKGSLRVNA